jgi:beta-lactamase regulating signal transducer with metallopeptidase domain
MIDNIWNWLLTVSLHSIALAMIVGLVTTIFRNHLRPVIVMLLWLIVLVRLVLPTLPSSPVGVVPSRPAIFVNATLMQATGVEATPAVVVTPVPIHCRLYLKLDRVDTTSETAKPIWAIVTASPRDEKN